jgi:hypothetical protein
MQEKAKAAQLIAGSTPNRTQNATGKKGKVKGLDSRDVLAIFSRLDEPNTLPFFCPRPLNMSLLGL